MKTKEEEEHAGKIWSTSDYNSHSPLEPSDKQRRSKGDSFTENPRALPGHHQLPVSLPDVVIDFEAQFEERNKPVRMKIPPPNGHVADSIQVQPT
eukprot:superscaffoldBa00003829_g17777